MFRRWCRSFLSQKRTAPGRSPSLRSHDPGLSAAPQETDDELLTELRAAKERKADMASKYMKPLEETPPLKQSDMLGALAERYRINPEQAALLYKGIETGELQATEGRSEELEKLAQKYGMEYGLLVGVFRDNAPPAVMDEVEAPRPVTWKPYLGEEECVAPFKVIGLRSVKSTAFVSYDWNPFTWNILPVGSKISPKLYVTFEDAQGKVVGPVCYEGQVPMQGVKFEFGPRVGLTWVKTLPKTDFDYIPTEFKVRAAFDAAFAIGGFGPIYSHYLLFTEEDLQGFVVKQLSTGTALGLSFSSSLNRITQDSLKEQPFESMEMCFIRNANSVKPSLTLPEFRALVTAFAAFTIFWLVVGIFKPLEALQMRMLYGAGNWQDEVRLSELRK